MLRMPILVIPHLNSIMAITSKSYSKKILTFTQHLILLTN